MKHSFCLLFIVLLGYSSNAQLIKDIGRGIKRDAEYKVEQKARDAARKAIDSLGSKKKQKKNEKEATTVSNETKQGDPEDKEGFITLDLSTPVTSKGLSVTIRGASAKHGKWNSVKILVKGPADDEEINAPLNDSGVYHLVYDKLLEEGDYIITATSSDGKAKVSARLKVNDISQQDDEIKDLMDATGTAFERLKNRASRLKGMISSSDDITLQTKIGKAKDNLDALHDALRDVKNGKKDIAKSGKAPSKNAKQHLTKLNHMVSWKTEEVNSMLKIAGYELNANSICEYISLLNETCAVFSTLTNEWVSAMGDVIEDITQEHKSFAAAMNRMDGLKDRFSREGLASGVKDFALDVLLKDHCGVFRGSLKHSYNYAATSKAGVEWWTYGVKSEAAIVLYYPKSNMGIIKMEGTIEGNATDFKFYALPGANPDYQQSTGGKVETTPIKDYTPFSLPGATSLHDELGYGMISRAVISPAYFLIPIEGEYNTETGKIKIFINEAFVDFLPTIFNSQIFIQWAAGLPKLRRLDYPISKVRLTINAALKDKNEFVVKKDAKGNPYIKETIKRHIDGDRQEHDLDISISVKKE
jgi:hypothetical protein